MTIDVTTNTINFEEDQQDAMKRTDNIQSLADQVERLEECDKSIENMEAKLKNLKKSSFQVWRERVYGRKVKHAKI